MKEKKCSHVKRCLGSVLVVFVVFQIIEFVVHGLILSGTYASLANLWRPNMMDFMWIMTLVSLLFTIMFVYFYTHKIKVHTAKSGLEYGLIIGFMMGIYAGFGTYPMYDIPLTLACQWTFFVMLQYAVGGLVLGAMHEKCCRVK